MSSSTTIPTTSESSRHPPPTARRYPPTSISHPTPRTAQTRSMTKLAQNRPKHLEQYIQQQERAAAGGANPGAARSVFGGKVKQGKRGVLLDSLKNAGGGRDAETATTGGEGKRESMGSVSTAFQPARALATPSIPRGTTMTSAKTTTTQTRPTDPRPFVDDDESEDELLLTPRKQPPHQSAPLSSITGKTGWQRPKPIVGTSTSGQNPKKSTLWKSTLAVNTPPKAGPSTSSSAAGPVKRKRPSNGPSTPTTPGRSDIGMTHSGLIGTPNRSSVGMMVDASEGTGGASRIVPNTVTPERRHKEKKRRISDSPTKVLAGKSQPLVGNKDVGVESVGESEVDGMEVEVDVDARPDEMDLQIDRSDHETEQTKSSLDEPSNNISVTASPSVVPKMAPPRPAPLSTLNRSMHSTNNMTSSFPLRKQVYPSTLGPGASSGPSAYTPAAAIPRRVVRTVSDRTDVSVGSTPMDTMSSKDTNLPRPTRREGLGSDVKGSLYGLSAALAKLQVKASVPAPSSLTGPSGGEKRRMGGFAMPTASSAAKSVSTPGVNVPLTSTATFNEVPTKPTQGLKRSSTMNGRGKRSSLTHIASGIASSSLDAPVRQVARATSTAPESTLSRSFTTTTHFQTLIESDVGSGCLKGVVAFVDVRTAEGDDAGSVFIEMLKSCGAKVRMQQNDARFLSGCSCACF